MSKARKFITKPSEFWRDFFLKRAPIKLPNGQNLRLAEKKQPNSSKAGRLDAAQRRSHDTVDGMYRSIMHGKFQITFPIDIVYTWVDGADEGFVKSRERYRATHGEVRPEAVDLARFESRDELRYSLRSLARYAPWINHIYIVTNGQVPNWLNLASPQITVVPHSAIIPEQYLPTFNSHVIETCLHRIPGLSEHYLYLNDDVLLTRPVKPSYYFNEGGLAYLFATNSMLPNGPRCKYDTPTQWAAKNARDLLLKQYGIYFNFMYSHSVHPQLRSIAFQNEKNFEAELDICRKNKFRSDTDLLFASFLNHNVAYKAGRANLTTTNCFYFNIRLPEAKRFYEVLLNSRGTDAAPYSMCLNDHLSSKRVLFPDYAEIFAAFLNSYFPEESPFELGEPTEAVDAPAKELGLAT